MKILVTGANGLLGNLVCKLLTEKSYEFIRVSRQQLDLSSAEHVLQYCKDIPFTHIINTAAMTNVDLCETEKEKCYNDNVKSVYNLINASKAHIIHVSTDFVFDGSIGNLSEDANVNPLNYYGICKLHAEQILLKNQNSTILRTQLLHGPEKRNIISWVKESLEKGKEIPLLIDQWRSPTFVDDLAIASVSALELNSKGIYHISGYEPITPYLLAVEVADYFNLDKNLLIKTESAILNQIAKRPLNTTFNIDKAKRELKYNPQSIKESLKAYENI